MSTANDEHDHHTIKMYFKPLPQTPNFLFCTVCFTDEDVIKIDPEHLRRVTGVFHCPASHTMSPLYDHFKTFHNDSRIKINDERSYELANMVPEQLLWLMMLRSDIPFRLLDDMIFQLVWAKAGFEPISSRTFTKKIIPNLYQKAL